MRGYALTSLRLLIVLGCMSITRPTCAQQDDDYAREINAAIAAYNADEYAVAREHFLQAHALRPSARTWRGLGTTAFELKSYEDAARELTFALEDTRNALPEALRAETELTLRVAQRRLADSTKWAAAESGARDEPEAPPAPVAPPRDQPPTAAPGLGAARVAAIVLGATGIAALAAGIGFGIHSMGEGRQRDRLCPPAQQPVCTPEAQHAADAAITAGNASTVTFIAAGTLLTTSLILWLTGAPSKAPTQLTLTPAGAVLTGSF